MKGQYIMCTKIYNIRKLARDPVWASPNYANYKKR
jgi:hypothetical protein